VKFGSQTVQYQAHGANTGQLQLECIFTGRVNPVKFKALLDPFNIMGTSPFSKLGFGGGLGRYLDPLGLFLSQPAKIDYFGSTDCTGDVWKSQVYTGLAEGRQSLRRGGTMKTTVCYDVQEVNGFGTEAPIQSPGCEKTGNFVECQNRRMKCFCSGSNFMCHGYATTSTCWTYLPWGSAGMTEAQQIGLWPPKNSAQPLNSCESGQSSMQGGSVRRNFRVGTCR
jgi:hypothetical protein